MTKPFEITTTIGYSVLNPKYYHLIDAQKLADHLGVTLEELDKIIEDKAPEHEAMIQEAKDRLSKAIRAYDDAPSTNAHVAVIRARIVLEVAKTSPVGIKWLKRYMEQHHD